MPELTDLATLSETPHAEVFDRREPRTVRLQLDAGESVPPHTHPGTDVVLHLLSGHLEVTLDDETYDVEAGELLQFGGNSEASPRAVEDSTAVIVLAPAVED